jgi:hypothetical protein
MMRMSFPVCLVSFALLLSGCATSYRVKIDATAKPGADAISYALRNAASAEEGDSLRYREVANHVRTALSGRGLYEAPPNVTPDVIVSIDYGVTPHVRREMIMRPREADILSTPGIGVDSEGNRVTPKPPTMEQVMVVTTTYEKYLHLTARENKPSEKDGVSSDIWSVDVTSEGKSKNLREYVPILVAASIEYVGKDSQGQKSIRIKDADADVTFVKKGM